MMQWIALGNRLQYAPVLDLMEGVVLEIINKSSPNTCYLLEYDDVYTAGTSAVQSELLDTTHNIPIVYSNRGGRFTYHGPGQRIIYPIIDLSNSRDIRLYISLLSNWIIDTLSKIGIRAFVIDDKVGIWTYDQNKIAKIASIGIRVKKWVAYHGIAININTDLSKFASIIPCGIKNSSVTSIKKMGIDISFDEFDKILQILCPAF